MKETRRTNRAPHGRTFQRIKEGVENTEQTYNEVRDDKSASIFLNHEDKDGLLINIQGHQETDQESEQPNQALQEAALAFAARHATLEKMFD